MEVQKLWNGMGENMTDQTGIWVSTNRAIIWHQLTITFLPLNRSPPLKDNHQMSFTLACVNLKVLGVGDGTTKCEGKGKMITEYIGIQTCTPWISAYSDAEHQMGLTISQLHWIQYKYTFYSMTQILAQVTFGNIATPGTGMLNTCNGKESGDASPREKIIHIDNIE